MKKKQALFILLLLVSGLVKAQVFTRVKTGFSGVINPVMSWVISNDSTTTSYAFLSGDNYLNNKHYIIARFGKNIAKSYFKNVSAPFPALYRGDAAAADYNKDGHVDMVMTGLNSNGVPVMDLFKNSGYGRFSLVPGPFVGQYDGSIEWGDFDHDGDMDILVTGKLRNNKLATIIYRNDRGVFTKIITDVPGVYDGCARWGDFEGNGKLDILITGNDGNGPITAIYKYVNGRYFLLSQKFVQLENSAAACADFDGDGKLDFFETGKNQYGFPECHLYANLGKAVFKDVTVAIRPLMRGSVDAADYDRDGHMDLLLTGESSERPYTLVYHNNKNFNFVEVPTTIPGVVNGKALWGDYDHDGDMDILISGIDVCYDFLGAVYRDNMNPPKQEENYSSSIFNNAPTPIYKRGPYYYYVFSSCYCDPSGGNYPGYHMYISNVHLQQSPYNLNYRFNDLLLKLVPNWNKTDRGHRTSNGFLTRKEAEQSRTEMISSYRATHFKIHYLNW